MNGSFDFTSAVAEDMKAVIRPGGVTQKGFWNKNAQRFMYAPSLKFHDVPGVDHYYVEIFGEPSGNKVTMEQGTPVVNLRPHWDRFPVGYVTVVIEGKDRNNRQVGEVESRFFWKKAPYGNFAAYPKRVRPYSEAASLVYDYLLNLPALKYIVETGKPDPSYRLNCYPTKMHSAVAAAMVRFAKLNPLKAEAAMRLACASADYLLSIAEPKDAALPGWTPTYDGRENASGRYAGQCMTSYPASAGNCFLIMHEATGESKYLDAAVLIAETYVKLQDENGEWPLKVMFADASSLGPNKLFPPGIISYLRKIAAATGRDEFEVAAARAEKHAAVSALETWNWEGQFEDVEPQGMYENMTHHSATSTAIRLLKEKPGDQATLAITRDILRYAEDQFVDWERPFKDHTPMVWGPYSRLTWHYDPKLLVDYPAVNEQYQCYCPVDSSAGKLIQTYLALYRAEKNPLDLAKARTLGDTMTFVQRDDGSIPTWWRKADDPKRDWFNCMIASASALAELAEYEYVR